MTHLLNMFSAQHEALILDLQHPYEKQGMMMQDYIPNTRKWRQEDLL